jgi:pimeloyl-ACP methyl ester carboxylesterase
MVIFEESGHCPMWEEPQKFNQVVGDWIAAL